MKVRPPKPFTYRAGKRAVLLLHGFTGNTVHVRTLGKFLSDHDFTCHAPVYQGHGVEPYKLLQYGPDDWWQDVINGYNFLKSEGYEDIAVCGVSLGGLFSLKLATELPVKAIVSMSSPILEKSVDDLFARVQTYTKAFKQMEGKNEMQVELEMKQFERLPMENLKEIQKTIIEVRSKLAQITEPALIIQGKLDEPLYLESAQIIYENIRSEIKQLNWYEKSGHIIPLEPEKEKVYQDIVTFLNSLDW